MLRDSFASTNCDVELAVKQLVIEDYHYDLTERRSCHRQVLVRPVSILVEDSQLTIAAISRNISSAGICLLTKQEISRDCAAKLSIHSLSETPQAFLANCRWCSTFGTGWYLSGWSFVNLVRRSRG
ncbi:MAG: PilZ domain-containing protein [Pirellulaceae bacterium]|nr:PilZ domain-containing protein [Pirellulaceae bacterium]